MVSKKMEQALNEQINAELYSAYLYLSMEVYFESLNLRGFANWMRAQTQEELVHAMKIHDFVNGRGGRVILKPIAQPPNEWESPLAVFESAYKHEQKVTGLINRLVDVAIEQKDHAANSFLQWFVDEQVEEESSVNEVLLKLRMAENAPGGQLLVDREVGQRVFKPFPTEGDK